MDCLTTLVGLTQHTCDCWQGEPPEGYDQSDTGYFLTDEGDGFPLLAAVYESMDCGRGDTIFDVLTRCRAEAIREVTTDVGARLYALRDGLRQSQFFIGRNAQKGGSRPRTATAGIELRPHTGYRDAILRITSVALGTTSTGAVTLTLRSDQPGFPEQTVPINTVPGWNRATVNWSLPFWADGTSEAPTYTITYPTAGVTVIPNNFYCCGARPEWARYVTAEGLDGTTHSTAAYGVSIGATLACDATLWMCRAESRLVNVIAKAIQFKGAELLARYVLESTNLNRYTTLDAARLQGKLGYFAANYQTRIEYLSQQAPETACLGCKKTQVVMTTVTL